VAAKAHQKESTKSANRPSSRKTIQNIFFCIGVIVRVLASARGVGQAVELRSTDGRGWVRRQPRRLWLRKAIILLAFGRCEKLIITPFF
jgi:hypothetical protein